MATCSNTNELEEIFRYFYCSSPGNTLSGVLDILLTVNKNPASGCTIEDVSHDGQSRYVCAVVTSWVRAFTT